jgi:peptide/nickel transport system ATP-binding protein
MDDLQTTMLRSAMSNMDVPAQTDERSAGSEAASAPRPVLEIENLHTHLFLRSGVARAVNGVSLTLYPGETLGIVGESGCGKSMTALSIMRLVPDPPARIVAGRIRLDGRDLLDLPEPDMRKVRGKTISMIFQEPMTSLNPVVTIGRQISEAIVLHEGLSAGAARDKTIEMLQLVRIPEARRRLDVYPHQLSGGMRQRVMIAMALSCNPKILLADEPTTALDVTIQAQIMALITELREKLGTAMILITHDLGLVAQNADRVVVMYAGEKVEEADVTALFSKPHHPYTRGLLGSVPRLAIAAASETGRSRLTEIRGSVPRLTELPSGCSFEPRCPFATSICRTASPPLEQKRSNHWAACWNSDRVVETAA